MKKILVPIDFSEVSRNALTYAVEMAGHYQAEVMVMHAYLPSLPEPYLVASFQDEFELEQAKLAEKYFNDIRLSLPKDLVANLHIDFRIELGGAIESILKVAEEWKPDMTVLGMRSGNPVSKKLFGSTTVSILQRLDIPVMVIPAGVKFQPVSRVVFASELENEEINTLADISRMLQSWNPEITCVHVGDNSDVEEDLKLRRLKHTIKNSSDLSNVNFVAVNDNDVSEGVLHIAERQRVQMVTMRTHLRGFWGRLIRASHSKDLARKTTLPLLIFPMKEVTA